MSKQPSEKHSEIQRLARQYSTGELISALKQRHKLSSLNEELLIAEYRELINFYERKLKHSLSSETDSNMRVTLMAESKTFNRAHENLSGLNPLPIIPAPNFSKTIDDPLYISAPTDEHIEHFRAALTTVNRFDTRITMLDGALLIPQFLSPVRIY